MKQLFFITAALFLSSLHCIANADYSVQWQRANNFYQQKEYDSAAYYYEQIAALHPINEVLYYNLGNTYYRLNKIGPAVLNYERALKIKPTYQEAKDNLMLTQSRIPNNIHPAGDIFFIRWWNAITAPQNATGHAVMALAFFLFYICLLLAKRFKKIRLSNQWQGVFICVCLCFLALAFFATRSSMQRTGAVVMEAESPLMNRELKGKPLSLLPEGTILKVEQERGDWVQVMLPDGREGWLRQDLITRI